MLPYGASQAEGGGCLTDDTTLVYLACHGQLDKSMPTVLLEGGNDSRVIRALLNSVERTSRLRFNLVHEVAHAQLTGGFALLDNTVGSDPEARLRPFESLASGNAGVITPRLDCAEFTSGDGRQSSWIDESYGRTADTTAFPAPVSVPPPIDSDCRAMSARAHCVSAGRTMPETGRAPSPARERPARPWPHSIEAPIKACGQTLVSAHGAGRPLSYAIFPASARREAVAAFIRFLDGILAALCLMLMIVLAVLAKRPAVIPFALVILAACLHYGRREEPAEWLFLPMHRYRNRWGAGHRVSKRVRASRMSRESARWNCWPAWWRSWAPRPSGLSSSPAA